MSGLSAAHMMEQKTGWSNLPVEMMCEVIKHLDPKSRMQLRATAKLERDVVDSNKRKVEQMTISACQDKLAVWIKDERFDGSIDEMTYFVNSKIKAAKVQVLQIFAAPDGANYWKPFLEKITEGGNFKFPIIDLQHEDSEKEQDFHLFFKMCAPGTEHFQFFKAPEHGFKKVLGDDTTKDVLLGAKILQFNSTERDVPLANHVVEAWIRNDQTIGKKIICLLGGYIDGDELETYEAIQPIEVQVLTDFKNLFSDRVVEDKEKSVRIRMDDESKHIVVRIVQEEDVNEIEVVVVWEVIRADLSEDQFEKTSGQVYVP